MGLTLTEKILKAHLVDGEYVKGQEIGIKIALSTKYNCGQHVSFSRNFINIKNSYLTLNTTDYDKKI